MILVFDEKHKNDLSFIERLPMGVLDEFCKIALQLIKAGGAKNTNMFLGAAQKLKVTKEEIQSCVEGLVHLFTESAKHKLSETDFLDSLLFLELDEEVKARLKDHYVENLNDIRTLLSDLSFELPHYQNLAWRLDIQIASRTQHQQFKPEFLLELTTVDGQDKTHKQLLQADYVNMKRLCTELESALKEAQSGHTRRVVRSIRL